MLAVFQKILVTIKFVHLMIYQIIIESDCQMTCFVLMLHGANGTTVFMLQTVTVQSSCPLLALLRSQKNQHILSNNFLGHLILNYNCGPFGTPLNYSAPTSRWLLTTVTQT